jgi:hypothetical protein
MEQIPDGLATQEIPRLLWTTLIPYFVHKSPPLVPFQSQINPLPILRI